MTTVAFASRHPDRLERFIACDFNIVSSAANESAWKERIKTAKVDSMSVLAKQTIERWFTPESRDTLEWKRTTSMIAAASVDGLESSAQVLYDYDETDNMKSIKLPGLYVVGKGDGKLPDIMRKFVTSSAPTAKLEEIESAGHLPMVENFSAFVESIESFLQM